MAAKKTSRRRPRTRRTADAVREATTSRLKAPPATGCAGARRLILYYRVAARRGGCVLSRVRGHYPRPHSFMDDGTAPAAGYTRENGTCARAHGFSSHARRARWRAAGSGLGRARREQVCGARLREINLNAVRVSVPIVVPPRPIKRLCRRSATAAAPQSPRRSRRRRRSSSSSSSA